MLPRPMSESEKTFARGLWPGMDMSRVYVTGEATDMYNCLGWTLGVQTWVWPWRPKTRPVSIAEFDDLYTQLGHPLVERGPIAAYGILDSNMKHGALHRGSGASPDNWGSKCGEWLRISHNQDDIIGNQYGGWRRYYAKGRAMDSLPEETLTNMESEEELDLRMPEGLTILDAATTETVNTLADKVSTSLTEDFENRYSSWVETWERPEIAVSSNPGDRATSEEFQQLAELGPNILPLLMARLLQPDQFFALVAVDHLASPEIGVQMDLDDPAVLGGEQERARRTILRWLEKNA